MAAAVGMRTTHGAGADSSAVTSGYLAHRGRREKSGQGYKQGERAEREQHGVERARWRTDGARWRPMAPDGARWRPMAPDGAPMTRRPDAERGRLTNSVAREQARGIWCAMLRRPWHSAPHLTPRYAGRSTSWRRCSVALAGLCCALLAGASALSPAPAAAASSSSDTLDAEGRLLHRRLDLSAVQRWDRAARQWKSLGKPGERLLVVNLWSAHCQPCVDEFPLLRRIAAAWHRVSDVRFLFISDPPHDTEAAEVIAFWQQHAAEVPDLDPCRSTSDKLRAGLDNQSQPLTLLVDRDGVVRQAFVGAIQERGLASAMERLLKILPGAGRR
jgi:thiol-disulfide isomerase/thioredoxin